MTKIRVLRRRRPAAAPRRAGAAGLALMLAAAGACAEADGLPSQPLFQVPLYSGDIDMARWSTDYFEAGIGYNGVSGDSYKFGQYTGLYRPGPFAEINGRKAALKDDGSYYSVWGINLGLPSRQLGGTYGLQGKWGLAVEFDQLLAAQTDSGRFIFGGLGSNNLTLPAGFGGITGQPPADAAAVLPFEQGYGVRLNHDFLTLTGGGALGGGWELTGRYGYQGRDGTRVGAAVMGSGFGNARAAAVPEPIDDKTNEFEVGLQYATEQMQFKAGYLYSRYSNAYDALTWQNPYNFVNGWSAGSNVGFPTGYGRSSLDPNNDFHLLKADFAYNFSAGTRLVSSLQFGRAEQDQAFLPYSVNMAPLVSPGLDVPIGLPQTSLRGRVDTTLLDLTFTTRPLDRAFLKLKYSYDKRDNKTASNQYLYAAGDVLNQPAVPPGQTPNDVNSGQIVNNLPIGQTNNKFLVDGDYRLARGWKLRGWYQYIGTDYEVAAQRSRADSNINRLGAEISSRANEALNGDLKYVWARRRGADYTMNASYAATVTPPRLADVPFVQLPTLRYYSDADYTQDQVKATLGYTPFAPVALQLQADWWSRDYQGPNCGGPNDQLLLNAVPPVQLPAQCQGLTKATGQTYTLDGQYTFAEDLHFNAFYTWSRATQDQAGRAFASVATSPDLAADPARNWAVNSKTTDGTAGIGLKWTPFGKTFDLGAQYLYNQGRTAIDSFAGAALAAPGPLPDVRARLNSLQLYGKWQYSKNLALRLNYWYQNLSTDNWSYDGATPVSSNNVLLSGQSSPNYRANVIAVALTYSGW